MDWQNLGKILLSLVGTVAVIDLVALIVEGAHGLTKIRGEKNRWIKAVSLGILGGLFGIYATATGYTMDNGAVISLRDVGAMMAGCLGGPLAGAIAGTIAGVHRLFFYYPDLLGGTSIPCAISTLLIGVLCGLLYKPFDKLKYRGLWALLIGASSEVLHLSIAFFYVWGMRGIEAGGKLLANVSFPFILANSVAFGVMVYTRDMIGKYKKTELHAQQVENELNIATSIQSSMLPKIFPDFPGRKEFDMYASMNPAKEVGGDFFDFFFVDDDHFAFLIADVSGKGVPAALFMVTAKTLIKDNLQSGMPLVEAMDKSNAQLYEGNEAHMFVTCWIGVMELSTGKLDYVNCGHNPPAICRENEPFHFKKDFSGLVLGGCPTTHYRSFSVTLQEGERVLLYTDGVTEAMNKQNVQYGEKRLLAFLDASPKDESTQAIISDIQNDVSTFTSGAEQSDDITMLALHINGFYQSMKADVSMDSFDALSGFLNDKLQAKGVPEGLIGKMDIVFDELFSNIVKYSGAKGLTFSVFAGRDTLSMRFVYGGEIYDINQAPAADVSSPLGERKVGGLGLFMVHKLMDRVDYKVVNHHNVITVDKYCEGDKNHD